MFFLSTTFTSRTFRHAQCNTSVNALADLGVYITACRNVPEVSDQKPELQVLFIKHVYGYFIKKNTLSHYFLLYYPISVNVNAELNA
jgi:hypothetical protein